MNSITLKIGGVPEHFNIPWHQAIEQGLFQQQGLEIKWQDYPGGTGAMAKDLRSSDLDVAVLLTEGIVADIVKGNPSKIISVYVASPLIWGIHVPAHSNLQDVNELEAKRYAISRLGSGSHLMAFVNAQQQGWAPSKLELITVGDINGARQAFLNNEADVFMWEKFMTKPLVDSGEFRRVGECPTPWPCFVIAARQEIIDNHTPALQQLLAVIHQANQAFMQNPAAPQLVAEKFNLQPEDAATWFAATQWATEATVPLDMMETVIDTLHSLKIISEKPKAASLVANLTGVQPS
ncbi:ABC transporter substrate-binding protein [Adhaeribacter aerolatus]|uniref:ABC transporter substrate-binding protein n=1 Tax=Adhaeribacter aerolatus TaxID=670289 RepID=A0A512B1F3_9BACT|nr:substrate-binding domain-containing protein [Adhaeribacter aerolatus]GEO05791.1 ABC transporter substrate-binding protein [Adhaeribacter aerolatus]